MKILIKVSKEVLERSKNCLCCTDSCPTTCGVAVATRDLFPDANVSKIGINLFGYKSSDPLIIPRSDLPDYCYLPTIAILFIGKFDRSTPEERVLMTPFSFEIEVPEYVIDKIGISTIYKVLSESSTLEMVM